MLRVAHWSFDRWARWHMARDAWAICRISHRDTGYRWPCTCLGMGPPLAALAMRKTKAFNGCHSWIYDAGIRSRRQLTSLGRRRGADNVWLVKAVSMKGWLLPVSLSGAGLAAVCCLTPFLPWLFSLFGISGALVYIYRDDVLLPILAGFLLLTGYSLWRRKRTK